MNTRIVAALLSAITAMVFVSCQKAAPPQATNGGRKIRFYQCSMHPQVKSDKPGKCTICGMDLVPIFEGESGASETSVALSSNAINVIHVQTEPVKRGALTHTIRVAGTIEDDDTKHRIISAYIDARIDKLFVNYVGAEVKAGEPLAVLYSPGLLAAEREYLALVQNVSSNANHAVQEDFKHLTEGAVQRLKRFGLTDEQIRSLPKQTNELSQTKIVSPISGAVVARHVYEGQYVKEGDKLFEVADFSVMWFQFDAYERDLPWLKVGQGIEVTTPAVPGKTYDARISFIDPNLNDPTRSAKVRVEIPNPIVEQDGRKRRELYHRLYAEGSVRVEFPETIVVSRDAVLNAGGEPMIYIEVTPGNYEPRQIRLGRLGDNGWEVLSGLAEGEKVVTRGNLLIDAQAQLNRGGEPNEHQHSVAALPSGKNTGHETHMEKLSGEQTKAVGDFLSLAATFSRALAADDLKEFNQQTAKLPGTLGQLTNSFVHAHTWLLIVEPVEKSAKLTPAPDLAEARREFVPFTMAVAEFARRLRTNEKAFRGIKIFRCPMANQAVPDAPKNGLWIQEEASVRNPFFGTAMVECGTEVKP